MTIRAYVPQHRAYKPGKSGAVPVIMTLAFAALFAGGLLAMFCGFKLTSGFQPKPEHVVITPTITYEQAPSLKATTPQKPQNRPVGKSGHPLRGTYRVLRHTPVVGKVLGG